jgi:hypothetical protein
MFSKKSKSSENDETELLLQNGDVDAAMARLDFSVDRVTPNLFLSSARGANRVLKEDKKEEKEEEFGSISLVVTAARSLLPKFPSEEERSLILDVLPETTEKDCEDFFERIFPLLFLRDDGDSKKNNIKKKRIYIALDDNASQNLKSIIFPFTRFVEKYSKAEKGGGILVHCVLGRSRSVALVAGCLMFGSNPPRMLVDVLDEIRKARPVAEVNPVFGAQMFSIWVKKMQEWKEENQNKKLEE